MVMASKASALCVFLFVFYLFISSLGDTSDSEIVESQSDEFVLTLGLANFSETIRTHNFVVVEFYSPWCGHCQTLAPEYEKAASVLSSHDPPVVLAKVDVVDQENRPLHTQYEISSFPTIKIFRNGGENIQEYKGPRDADGIVAYLKKQRGPASAEIKSAEDATSLIDGNKIVVVGVFPEFCGEKFENFMALAEKLRSDYEFGHTLNANLLPRGESSVIGPAVRLFKPFDELNVDFQDFDADVLEKFIEEASVPLVTLFNNDPSNDVFVSKFFNNPNAKAMLFLNFSSGLFDAFKSKYHEISEKHKGQGIHFLLGDSEFSERVFEHFGLKHDQVPLLVILSNDGQNYLKTNMGPELIAPWVNEYLEGKVLPYRKSEPIPEVNNEPVKVVVADSFQDIVFKSGKNVLLEFYAPWCGHCKQLAPTLDEVAVSFQNDKDIIIAKMDATANDILRDTFDVKGYPTLYFKSATGNLSFYDGDRTKEDIIGFILKNRDNTGPEDSSKYISGTDSRKDEL